MKQIASFSVDHDKIRPGMYISRIDGDITSFDLRTRTPNAGEYMDNITMHSVEHMLATFLRNGEIGEHVIYFGPMGCRTGFYFLVRDMAEEEVIALVQETLRFIADFVGTIPGSTAVECGNYLEHDLPDAKRAAKRMCEALRDWTPDRLLYPKA